MMIYGSGVLFWTTLKTIILSGVKMKSCIVACRLCALSRWQRRLTSLVLEAEMTSTDRVCVRACVRVCVCGQIVCTVRWPLRQFAHEIGPTAPAPPTDRPSDDGYFNATGTHLPVSPFDRASTKLFHPQKYMERGFVHNFWLGVMCIRQFLSAYKTPRSNTLGACAL